MNLEDYKQLHEALETTFQGTGTPFREPLEKSFDWNAKPLAARTAVIRTVKGQME